MGTPHGIILNVLWVWVVSYHFHVAVYQNPPKFPPAKCFPCTARKSLSRVSSNTCFWNGLDRQEVAPPQNFIAASRTPPWLASEWGCRGRRLSRPRRSPGRRHGSLLCHPEERMRAPDQVWPARGGQKAERLP